MLAFNTPVTTVAQVLDHKETDSTKCYITVDKEHLKMYALLNIVRHNIRDIIDINVLNFLLKMWFYVYISLCMKK